MTDYKAGDRVEMIEDYTAQSMTGDKGTIRKQEFDIVYVNMDNHATIACYTTRVKPISLGGVFAVFETTIDGGYTTGIVEKYNSEKEAQEGAELFAAESQEYCYYIVKLLSKAQSEKPKVTITKF